MPPFFSIGVTTYDRHDLLRQTLASVLSQDFTDFEVVIGNDDPSRVLAAAALGIDDARVRIINNPENLRETANMNSVLAAATGRYFTWLADDDLYRAGILRIAHEQLRANDFPDALFTSYELFDKGDPPFAFTREPKQALRLTGRTFLDRCFSPDMKIISVYGFFETVKLRSVIGGIAPVSDSAVGLYSEYLFMVRCGLLDSIVYVDEPLILYRAHEASWSATNLELDRYVHAGPALVRMCGEVLRQPGISDDLDRHLMPIWKLHLRLFAWKSALAVLAERPSGVREVRHAVRRHLNHARSVKKASSK